MDGGRLWFGSEMRAVHSVMRDKIELDALSVNLFLRYRYTPSPHTVVKGVKKLAPGTKLVIEDGRCEVSRWYRFKPAHHSPVPTTEDAEAELLGIYQRAVRRHLISDVPVGLLLSGGLDSGLLLALMNLNGDSWPTFTVGYGSSFSDDELVEAEQTARVLNAKHTSITISRWAFEQALPKIIAALEEPVATSSIVPMYFVCERARQDVKVALVGQGPDELFGGYRRHLGVRYGEVWARLPKAVRGVISSGVNALPRSEMLKRGVYSLAIPDRMRRYEHVFCLMPGDRVDGLFGDGVMQSDAADSLLQCWAELADLMQDTDELGGLQFLEVRSSLPDELLMYADKLSMAHGLELRVPYLDKEIVEYAERLPATFKVRNGSRKWLHRQVCRKYLPQAVLKRPKRGFGVNVVDGWFRDAANVAMTDSLLDESSAIYQYLRPEAVKNLVAEHSSGRRDNHKILFSLVVLQQWLRLQTEPATAVA